MLGKLSLQKFLFIAYMQKRQPKTFSTVLSNEYTIFSSLIVVMPPHIGDLGEQTKVKTK